MPSRISRIKQLALRAAPLAVLLSGIPSGTLAQADPNICIPSIGGLAAAPTIDGVVEGDPGWNGAFRVNLKQSIGAPRVGSMQLGRVGGFLYLSFEVEGAPTPGFDDLVVLGFQTTGSAAQDWRMHVFPFTSDDVGSGRPVFQNDPPRQQLFWRDSGNWKLRVNTAVTPCSSLADRWRWANCGSDYTVADVKVSRNGNNWSMEMKIPTSSNIADAAGNALLYLPSSPTLFKLYVNVLSTNDLGFTYTEDPWPQGAVMLTVGPTGGAGENFAENRTPDPSAWATASTFSRSACNGVYMSWNSGVGVRQSPGGTTGYYSQTGQGPFRVGGTAAGALLTTAADCEAPASMLTNDTPWPLPTVPSPLPSNYFVAKPGNDGTAAAPRVYARFYVAPWGIPGAFDAGAPDAYWHPVGELYRPTGALPVDSTPEASIPVDVTAGTPALASPLITPAWQLSYKQACVYTKSYGYGMLGHHCIQADVHSNDPSVRIKNKSIQINHNFVEASVALRDAQISLKGRVKPADKGNREVILFSHKLVQSFRRDGPAFHGATIKGEATAVARGLALAPVSAQVPAQFRALGPVPADRFPKGIDEGMTVITNGYLKTNDSLIIGSRSYRRAQYLGGFSYFAGHAGVARNWVESIALGQQPKSKLPSALAKAPTLQPLEAGALQAKAPQGLPISAHSLQFGDDDTVILAVRAEAQEGGEPPCDCLDFACRNRKADAGGAISVAGLFLIGGLGIGGFAFVRRKKASKEEAEDGKRPS